MILKDYEKLPEKMKNEKVKEYYDTISKKEVQKKEMDYITL